MNQYFGTQQNVFLPPPIILEPTIVRPTQLQQIFRPIIPVELVQPIVPVAPPVPICEVIPPQFIMIRNKLASQTSS